MTSRGRGGGGTRGGAGRPAKRAVVPARAALRLVTEALLDRKAVEPLVLDLRELSAATDYFVIVSGTSDAHVRGMAEHLMTALAPHGIAPHHVEGLTQGRWVLLDYVRSEEHTSELQSRLHLVCRLLLEKKKKKKKDSIHEEEMMQR